MKGNESEKESSRWRKKQGEERRGKERKGKERKGRERQGKERQGTGKEMKDRKRGKDINGKEMQGAGNERKGEKARGNELLSQSCDLRGGEWRPKGRKKGDLLSLETAASLLLSTSNPLAF